MWVEKHLDDTHCVLLTEYNCSHLTIDLLNFYSVKALVGMCMKMEK